MVEVFGVVIHAVIAALLQRLVFAQATLRSLSKARAADLIRTVQNEERTKLRLVWHCVVVLLSCCCFKMMTMTMMMMVMMMMMMPLILLAAVVVAVVLMMFRLLLLLFFLQSLCLVPSPAMTGVFMSWVAVDGGVAAVASTPRCVRANAL